MQFTNKFSIQWVSVCLLLAAATISAQEINISHCLKSCPDVSRPTNEVSLHHVFAASVIPKPGRWSGSRTAFCLGQSVSLPCCHGGGSRPVAARRTGDAALEQRRFCSAGSFQCAGPRISDR